MKTFFYTVAPPKCAGECHYLSCPKRYLQRLEKEESGEEFYPLTGPLSYGQRCNAPFPKRGDVIILFIEDREDLERMNSCRESFDGLKKVLVVANGAGIDGSMYHKLAPRFITQANRAVTELKQVVQRMKTPVINTT